VEWSGTVRYLPVLIDKTSDTPDSNQPLHKGDVPSEYRSNNRPVTYESSVLDQSTVWFIIGQSFYCFLVYLREVFSPVPEEIKLLRFPLYNNSELSREKVWAYFIALQFKTGSNHPEESFLFNSILDIKIFYPFFNSITALKELEKLNIVSEDIIKAESKNIFSYESKNEELYDIRKQRDGIIAKATSEGGKIPVDGFIKSLNKLLESNPENKELFAEVDARKKEMLTKYKDGIPIDVAYQWQMEGEEEFGWDVIHKN
jgi:hypothetical protein